MEWFLYVPNSGDWRINYNGDSAIEARKAYLEQSGYKRLPNNSHIWSRTKK
jgi:hypothetical protein